MSVEPRESATGGCTTRRSELWYLVFLASLAFQPMFDADSRTQAWIAGAAAVLLFVPLHVRLVYRGDPWLERWAPALTTILGVATLAFNGGATVFFVYAAAYAAGVGDRRRAYRWFAGLSLGLLVLVPFVDLPLGLALAIIGFPAVLVWMIGMMVLEEAERDRAAEQLRIDNARIEHLATATERERLASDLHDLLGQSLTEVIVRAQLIRRLIESDPARAATEAETIETSSRRALDQGRAAVRGWNEVRLDDELEVARRTLDAAGVGLHVERDQGFDPPPTTETAIALAVREGVTNVVRHAQATMCRIDLCREGDRDVLRISDDGRGSGPTEGNGLVGMRAREIALGGELERDGSAGTTLTVRLPSGVPT
jgi:two-component system, NarL family, sensor histidine kinase DesK